MTVVDLAPDSGQEHQRERTATAYPDGANADLLSRIPLDARTILDVGCGTGALGAAYRAVNSAARLLGIERDPEMAAIAGERLDAVACVDVQQNPLPFELPDGIDCLIYGDVLQQLRDPWIVLRRQLEALNPGGSVLVCVANAEHWSMVARLLRGNWHYEPAGLFDVRHLRWFSLRNVMRELADAGLVVEEIHPRIFAPEQAQQFVQTLAPGLQRLGIDPGGYLPRAMPLQYVFCARRAGSQTTTASAASVTDQSEGAILEEEALIEIEADSPPPLAEGGLEEGADRKSDDEPPLSKLLMNFESLGDNCEFGLVQRQAGAEPLGLLRFASPYVPIEVRLRTVTDAIERRFEGLGTLDTVHLKLEGKPERREYLVHESAYQLLHHTFVHEGEVDPEEFRRKEARRLVFLRDKLLSDLAAGEKLWVWKSNLPLSYDDIRPLLGVLRRLGPNSLLWVVVADAEHPPGTVDRIESDLLKGYVDRFAAYNDATNVSFESWYAVSRAAYALWRDRGSGDETGAVVVANTSIPASGDATDTSANTATKSGDEASTPIVLRDTSFISRSLLSMTETVELGKLRDTPFSRAVLAPAGTMDMPPCYVMNPPSAPLSLSDTPHNRIFPSPMRYPEMWLARLDDVYYLPFGGPFLPDPGVLINDFLVPWGPDAVGWFKYEGEGTYRLPIDLDEAQVVDTAFFMGHPISGHFGHFIGDCLSRMHAWQDCRKLFCDAKIILDRATHGARFREELLAGSGISPEDIVFARGAVRCRRLLFASTALGGSRYASPTSTKLWQQIRDALADPHAQGGERIYLSRAGQSGRKLRNEPEAEELFRSFGFTIVRPEELSLEEQVSTVSNAQLVAGPTGAAMSNLAFQRELKSVLILAPETFVNNSEWLFLAGARCPVYYHFGLRDMPAGSPVSASDAWRVDVSRLAVDVASWLWSGYETLSNAGEYISARVGNTPEASSILESRTDSASCATRDSFRVSGLAPPIVPEIVDPEPNDAMSDSTVHAGDAPTRVAPSGTQIIDPVQGEGPRPAASAFQMPQEAGRDKVLNTEAGAVPEVYPDLQGENYLSVLQRIHLVLRPKTYLEIGSRAGDTLALAECASIAVDPEFLFDPAFLGRKPACFLYQMTSDRFFDTIDPKMILGREIDFAFIDGMHLAEFLLRDFINTERVCRKNSIIGIHDCIPVEAAIARRVAVDLAVSEASRHPHWWTGDVWKVIVILKKFRPDLAIYAIDAFPTGLMLITNLDPASGVLANHYDTILSCFRALDLAKVGVKNYIESLGMIPSRSLRTIEDFSQYFWL